MAGFWTTGKNYEKKKETWRKYTLFFAINVILTYLLVENINIFYQNNAKIFSFTRFFPNFDLDVCLEWSCWETVRVHIEFLFCQKSADGVLGSAC